MPLTVQPRLIFLPSATALQLRRRALTESHGGYGQPRHATSFSMAALTASGHACSSLVRRHKYSQPQRQTQQRKHRHQLLTRSPSHVVTQSQCVCDMHTSRIRQPMAWVHRRRTRTQPGILQQHSGSLGLALEAEGILAQLAQAVLLLFWGWGCRQWQGQPVGLRRGLRSGF
jgi:hypothetical protein